MTDPAASDADRGAGLRVAVVGGGAVGVTAARDLAVRGADVDLYEREAIAAGSTGRAAGIVYDAFTEDVDVRLARRSIERFRERSGEGTFRLHDTPYVWFVTEADERADALREGVERMRAHDRDVSLVSPTDLRARFPQVVTEDVHLAAVAGDAAVADPESYAALLADEARAAGVAIREGVRARLATEPPRVTADGPGGDGRTREFDAVLVAAGAHTKRLLAAAGLDVAMKPYRVQALSCSGPAIPILYDATARYYARPARRGLLAGDGTERAESDPDEWARDADDAFVDGTMARLRERLLNFEGKPDRSWAGLCTATPDRRPLLGELAEGIHVATGWHGSGFMRAPAAAEAVAEGIVGDDGIDAFDPRRFDGDEEFPVVAGMDLDDYD